MLNTRFATLVVGVVCLVGAGEAKAQFFDMNSLITGELNFQNQFYPWAWRQSVAAAREIPNDAPLPFNATTLSHANQQANAAFGGYINSLQRNSRSTADSIGNWSNGAILGNGNYVDPGTGNMYSLPWTHPGYHLNQYQRAYPGHRYDGWGTNLYPVYGY